MKQLIFVVETDSSNQSDNRYIKKLILERYNLTNNDIKLQFVYMGGKSKYKDKSTISKINQFCKLNKKADNFIIYCFDTDRIDCSLEDKRKFDLEQKYCRENSFYLIWFNHNIEYVLLGKNIESSLKKQESIKFSKSVCISANPGRPSRRM